MAQQKLSIIEYAMIAGVGYVLYQVAISGGIGKPAQDTALSICKAFRSEAACKQGINNPDTGKPIASPAVPGTRTYPCGFVQDNGDGTYSFVKNYAPGGFTEESRGTKAQAEQAFNTSGLALCR